MLTPGGVISAADYVDDSIASRLFNKRSPPTQLAHPAVPLVHGMSTKLVHVHCTATTSVYSVHQLAILLLVSLGAAACPPLFCKQQQLSNFDYATAIKIINRATQTAHSAAVSLQKLLVVNRSLHEASFIILHIKFGGSTGKKGVI